VNGGGWEIVLLGRVSVANRELDHPRNPGPRRGDGKKGTIQGKKGGCAIEACDIRI